MLGCNGHCVTRAFEREYKGRADLSRMAGADRIKKPVKGKGKPKRGPDWASGLKQLYDTVVDEPIPDAFKDLLSRLDDGKR